MNNTYHHYTNVAQLNKAICLIALLHDLYSTGAQKKYLLLICGLRTWENRQKNIVSCPYCYLYKACVKLSHLERTQTTVWHSFSQKDTVFILTDENKVRWMFKIDIIHVKSLKMVLFHNHIIKTWYQYLIYSSSALFENGTWAAWTQQVCLKPADLVLQFLVLNEEVHLPKQVHLISQFTFITNQISETPNCSKLDTSSLMNPGL